MSLQHRWNEVCARTIGSDAFWNLSVDHRAAYAALAPLIENYAKGRVLDAGAGRMAWRSLLKVRASDYVATDYAQTHPEIAFVADLTKGLPFGDGSFDTIFCCSVLEHVEDPFAAMVELSRDPQAWGKSDPVGAVSILSARCPSRLLPVHSIRRYVDGAKSRASGGDPVQQRGDGS